MSRYLYHIRDAAGAVRYVGVANNPYRRFIDHQSQARWANGQRHSRGGDLFHQWFYDECRAGRRPMLLIVGIVESDWANDERREIYRLLEAGEPLMNSVVKGRRRYPTLCRAAMLAT